MSAVFGHGRLRLYLLKLLEESPRHGYEVIRLLRDRFLGVYAPSPGTIYPRLARLEKEGLVTHELIQGRKTYSITDLGRAELEQRRDELADLEEELSESVRDIAREVQEDVRHTVRSLREELTQAAKEVREKSREDAKETKDARRESRQRQREKWRRQKEHWKEQKRARKQEWRQTYVPRQESAAAGTLDTELLSFVDEIRQSARDTDPTPDQLAAIRALLAAASTQIRTLLKQDDPA